MFLIIISEAVTGMVLGCGVFLLGFEGKEW
jgi:hypothetical protein